MEQPYGPAQIFVARTGTVHLATERHWGRGAACLDTFLLGTTHDGVRNEITCKRCIKALEAPAP